MAKREPQDLTEEALARITRSIRSLTDDHVERGLDLSRPMHCDNCNLDKASAGATIYGAYKLCNECLLEFTVALSSGQVENVAEFMTRSPEPDGGLPLSGLNEPRDRSSLPFGTRSARDKLMPSNEPC